MSELGVAYKKVVKLTELVDAPATGDFFVVVDISNINKEKKILASRIHNGIVSYESNTVYFEGNVVTN